MSVLILAEDIDATCDGMVGALAERGAVVHRVNTAWFPAQLSVSVELRGGRWTGQIRTPGRVIETWRRSLQSGIGHHAPTNSPTRSASRKKLTRTWKPNTAWVGS
jgi:hypothetical protein